MLNKLKISAAILFLFIFNFLIVKHYFSEENFIFTNNSRLLYLSSLDSDKNLLPILKNDTKNIIIKINEVEQFKKKRKKRFWEKLISNKDE